MLASPFVILSNVMNLPFFDSRKEQIPRPLREIGMTKERARKQLANYQLPNYQLLVTHTTFSFHFPRRNTAIAAVPSMISATSMPM